MQSRLQARREADASMGAHRNELDDYLKTPLEDVEDGDVVRWWGVSQDQNLQHAIANLSVSSTHIDTLYLHVWQKITSRSKARPWPLNVHSRVLASTRLCFATGSRETYSKPCRFSSQPTRPVFSPHAVRQRSILKCSMIWTLSWPYFNLILMIEIHTCLFDIIDTWHLILSW
jgi:hypothetical protein